MRRQGLVPLAFAFLKNNQCLLCVALCMSRRTEGNLCLGSFFHIVERGASSALGYAECDTQHATLNELAFRVSHF